MGSDDWLIAKKAAERFDRSERTIRHWGSTSLVKRLRFKRIWFYYVPDLIKADVATITRTRDSGVS